VEQAGGVGLEVAPPLAAVGEGGVERDPILVELVEQRLDPGLDENEIKDAGGRRAVPRRLTNLDLDTHRLHVDQWLAWGGPEPEENP
jgi:hypothetical protein